jgi:hypothetical protein
MTVYVASGSVTMQRSTFKINNIAYNFKIKILKSEIMGAAFVGILSVISKTNLFTK